MADGALVFIKDLSDPAEHLNQTGVEKLWRKKIGIERLAKVRDAFIFQCFTGFAYQDIYNLSYEHIIYVGLENEPWLVKERGKTKVTEMVPVLPIISELIEKYKKHPYCRIHNRLIPVNSNLGIILI